MNFKIFTPKAVITTLLSTSFLLSSLPLSATTSSPEYLAERGGGRGGEYRGGDGYRGDGYRGNANRSNYRNDRNGNYYEEYSGGYGGPVIINENPFPDDSNALYDSYLQEDTAAPPQ